MVGIVLVSHSEKLAEGVKELAVQMTQNKVAIEAAGGIDDIENPIGTDAMKVMSAIESVCKDDDVLVLMDMGSALMSAEMAIQFLPEEMQSKVHLCAAPIAEGGVAAAVQAMLGSDIEEVKKEAINALQAKKQQLGITDETSSEEAALEEIENTDFVYFEVIVPNIHGLHARPASKMIQLAQGLEVVAEISMDETQWLNIKSLNNLTLLGAKQGQRLFFRIAGEDRENLRAKILSFSKDNFGDDKNEQVLNPRAAQSYSTEGVAGIPSSSGIAIAKGCWLQQEVVKIQHENTSDSALEKRKFENAIREAKQEIKETKATALKSFSAKEADIFDAHVLFLEDIELQGTVLNTIENKKWTAEKTWFEETEQIVAQYKENTNEYIQQRASDIKDIQQLLLKKLGAVAEVEWTFSQPTILLADNLQPSDTLKLDTTYVKGFILKEGNENAHTSILARSLGIPVITGVGENIKQIPLEKEILMDGDTGLILTNAASKEWKKKEEEKKEKELYAKKLKEIANKKAFSKNGIHIQIKGNISGTTDAKLVIENGADGVGLFRTELYFMNQKNEPTEQEQYELYKEVCGILQGRPLTIRTLDVGGDKPIEYFPMDKEENPFLGLRGIRFSLAYPQVFKKQLRAILRASSENDIQLMFPMISTIEEWKKGKALLEECKRELLAEKKSFNENICCGMMVEVPSVIMRAEEFAREVDFFSIGTNDLSQYLMAVDRGNAEVKYLIKDTEEAVLNAIEILCKAAKKYNKPVSVCGELGAKENVIPTLLNFGIKILSMNASQIPIIKQKIEEFTII